MIKDNRGFSFVEMMTVLVILCIMLLASYPIVILTVKNSKKSLYKDNVRELEKATINWATEHAGVLPDDAKDARFMTIKDLNKEGYIRSSNIKDPRDNKIMNGCVMVKKNDEKQYRASYHEQTCEQVGSKYKPIIKVKEDCLKTYEVNAIEDYKLPVLTAYSITSKKLIVRDPIIMVNDKVVPKVVGSKVGDIYTLLYKVKDPDNKLVSTIKFNIKIVDTKAPIITINNTSKSFTEEILVGDDYKIIKANVNDNSNLPVKVVVSTNLNTKLEGSYEVVYTATDKYDNVGLLVVTVRVIKDNLNPSNTIVVSNASALPGDGTLLKVSNSEYVFTGVNPNNYLSFKDELWRIVKIDSSGLKAIKMSALASMSYSSNGSTSYGDSNIKAYFTNTYVNLLKSDKVLSRKWNIGLVSDDSLNDFVKAKKNESSMQTDKYLVGLLNVSDVIKAGNNNYLTLDNYYLASASAHEKLVYAILNGNITKVQPSDNLAIKPVIYLNKYRTLSGEGTISNPYKLID